MAEHEPSIGETSEWYTPPENPPWVQDVLRMAECMFAAQEWERRSRAAKKAAQTRRDRLYRDSPQGEGRGGPPSGRQMRK
jgi:hypothetical protein